jgi:hypothetical protein
MHFTPTTVLATALAASSLAVAATSGYVGEAYNTTDCSNPGGYSETGFYNITTGSSQEGAGTCYPAHTNRALIGGIKSVNIGSVYVPSGCCCKSMILLRYWCVE